MSPDRNREVSVLVVVDASEGDFYSRGQHGATPFMVLDQTTQDGVPIAGRKGQAYPDPRSWRLHDLGTTAGGQDDLRVSVQVVNDYEGEWASPSSSGEAPLGQPEWFTGRNRSTREADLAGRVALPGSHRKIVDSEDGRYALAGTLPFVPLAGLAGEHAFPPSSGSGTRTRTSPTPGQRGPCIETALAPLSPDAYRELVGIVPGNAAREPEPAGGLVRVQRGAWGRRNKPAGLLTDSLGQTGSLASVITLGRRDPAQAYEPPLFSGREGTGIGWAAIRSDAPFAFASVAAPLCLDVRDAARVPDNLGGRQPPTTGTSGGELTGGRIELLDPAPDLPSGARPIKGRLHLDTSKVLRRATEGPHDPNLQPPLGNPLSAITAEIVPVLYVTAEDLGIAPPEIKQPPRKPPKKPPPLPPPGGDEEEEDEDEEEDEEPEDGPGAPLFPEALLEDIPEPPGGDFIPTKNQPQLKFGWDVGQGNDVVTVPGGQGDPIEDTGTGSLQDSTQPVGDGDLQARDYGGHAVPCPNEVNDSAQRFGSDSALAGPPKAGYVSVEQVDEGTLSVGGQTVEVVPPRRTFEPNIAPLPLVPGGATEQLLAGQRSIMSVAIPPPGTPGGPATLQGWAHLVSMQLRGVMAVLQGAFGGPGFLASNVGIVHKNSPGNPPAPSRIGSDWSADPGQALAVSSPALEVTSTLRANDGSTLTADGPAGCGRFVRAIQGNVRDDRPAVAFEGGGADGDLIAAHNQATGVPTAGRDFHVDKDAVVGCSGVRALLRSGQPQPEFPIGVAYQDPATGDQLGDTIIGLRSDGVQAIKDLSDAPDPPRDGSVLVYAKNGTAYQMTSDGTETALGSASGVTIQEEDGTPAGTLSTLKFPNGSLTDNGGGSFSISLASGLSNPVTVAQGGTGQTTAAAARTALGLAIGTDVQAYDSLLQDFSALVPAAGQYIGFDGGGNLAVVAGSGGLGGAGSGTDNRLVRWDGASAVQSSGWSLSDLDAMSGVSMTLTTPLVSTSGGTGLNGVADSKTIYSNAANTYTTGTMADAFGEIHPPGSGAWVAQAGTWTSLGTTSRNFLGSPAAGTMGFQGWADFTRSAGGGSGTSLAQFEQTSTNAASMVPLELDAHPSGGNHSAGAGLSVSAQRGGAVVGVHEFVNAYTTNGYDYGNIRTSSTIKFQGLDTSENCTRMNNSSGLNIVHESGSTRPTVTAGESRLFAFGSDGVPLMRSKVGTTTTDYMMVPENGISDPGDPSGYTDIITQIVPWMSSLRSSMQTINLMA